MMFTVEMLACTHISNSYNFIWIKYYNKAIHIHLMLCCDLSTSKTKFTCVIGYDLDPLGLKAMRIHIYDRIRYNMYQIKVGVDVCDTFSIMSFVIDSFVEILILTLFVDTFSIMFAEINMDFHKLSKFKYNHVNNNNIIVFMNTFSTIGGAAIVIGFFSAVIYFVIQLIDKSRLNTMLSIKWHAIVVGIAQVTLYLGAQLPIDE